jgi:hypothetical protein
MQGKGRKTPRKVKTKFTWDVAHVEGGHKFTAYVAGPHIRVLCHKHRFVRACLTEYTDGQECPGCVARLETCFISYMPIYRAVDKHELVCGFHEEQEDTLDKLEHLQGVVIGREEGFGCGLWINPATSLPTYAPNDPTRQRQRCIASWLPIVWKFAGKITAEEILAEGPAVPVPPPPPPVKPPRIKRGGSEEKAAAANARAKLTIGGVPLDQVFATEEDDRKRRNEEFARQNGNGKH